MTLLLFDIDGTLLEVTAGVHEAIERAISPIMGPNASTEGVSFSGRTDPDIFRDLLRKNGVSDPDPILRDVLHRYARTARTTIHPESIRVLPGVRHLLTELDQREDVLLGLVTGNVKPVAYHKLERVGIADPFTAGAFGNDRANRNRLPAIALQRVARESSHSVSLDNTVILGDTRHDIECAHESGMRSVAVCTGRFTRNDLAPSNPDLLLKDMSDPKTVIDQILRI